MLNYAYGVLIARTHVQLVSDGYDPTIGILHALARANVARIPRLRSIEWSRCVPWSIVRYFKLFETERLRGPTFRFSMTAFVG